MTVPTITRIAAVMDALADLTRTALTPLGVEVLDGPVLGELPWRHLMIGITDSPDTPPYTTRYTRQDGLGRPRYVEDFEIRCGLSIADGSNDLTGVRDDAVAALEALDTALGAQHTNPGVWQEIGLGEAPMSWYPVPHAAGSTVAVFFSIEGSSVL